MNKIILVVMVITILSMGCIDCVKDCIIDTEDTHIQYEPHTYTNFSAELVKVSCLHDGYDNTTDIWFDVVVEEPYPDIKIYLKNPEEYSHFRDECDDDIHIYPITLNYCKDNQQLSTSIVVSHIEQPNNYIDISEVI